ncbi:MAG: hypothetical protein PVG75_12880 [Thioalkalispiraceae bacterium]|jgi:hypothetical protein
MLDTIATTSETSFKRQVTPSVEGNLRPDTQRGSEQAVQNERVQQREANRLEQRGVAQQRQERQQAASDTSQRRHEHLARESFGPQSKAAELAEDLIKTVKESRREDARQAQKARFSPHNRSHPMSRAYMANLPIEQHPILDEMA